MLFHFGRFLLTFLMLGRPDKQQQCLTASRFSRGLGPMWLSGSIRALFAFDHGTLYISFYYTSL